MMKPLKEGWVVFTWSDLEYEMKSAFVEAVGIYTDKDKAVQVADNLTKLTNVEAWAEATPIDTTPLRFRIDDLHKISGRGKMLAGDLVMGSPNEVFDKFLHHPIAGTLKITGVETMGRNQIHIGLLVSGWENWNEDIPIKGLVCSIKDKP